MIERFFRSPKTVFLLWVDEKTINNNRPHSAFAERSWGLIYDPIDKIFQYYIGRSNKSNGVWMLPWVKILSIEDMSLSEAIVFHEMKIVFDGASGTAQSYQKTVAR